MRRNIITISGFPGSGKSSTAKGVAKRLGHEHFSSGDLFREMAAEGGLSVEEINLAAEKSREIDYAVDDLLQKIGQEKNNLVIDSRTAFHWIPDSFKVFLDLDPRISAERTLNQIKNEGRTSQRGSSIEEVYQNTLNRVESERKRYRDLYDIDYMAKDQFDLVVDTKVNNLEQVIDIVVSEYKDWLNST
ncbi:MAG: AAA family ATPase [Candidatus Liptonbacteria bacterium]